MKESASLEVIGMQEEVNFPKKGIFNLISKTDTGAYNSAIDCCHTEEKTNEKGKKELHFILLSPQHGDYSGKIHKTTNYRVKKVRSSNGIDTYRYQIKLKMELNGRCFKTTFNLSDRSKMRYAVLLGRKMMAGRFLVDVSKNRKLKT